MLIPCYEGVSGHPILISQSILPDILSYEGAGGLRAAVGARSCRLRLVSTNDPGVTISIHNGRQLGERVSEHNRTLLHPTMQLGLQRETVFFNSRMKLLLYLISYTHSVRSACGYMALSYGKAWDMLNKLEAEMGFPLVERRHGGSRGGNTTLTPRGLSFLEAWIQLKMTCSPPCRPDLRNAFPSSSQEEFEFSLVFLYNYLIISHSSHFFCTIFPFSSNCRNPSASRAAGFSQ